MSDKTKTKTKAELLEMLAEAVRNTQPQPVANTQSEPEQKYNLVKRGRRQSARPKSRPCGKLLGSSNGGVDDAAGDP